MLQDFIPTTDVTPKSADVIVTFTGLMLLRFDQQGKYCEVGIHPSQDHRLRIAVELWEGKSDKLLLESASHKLKERWEYCAGLQHPLHLKAIKPTEAGVRLYQLKEPLARAIPVSVIDEPMRQDFRWVLNLQTFTDTKLNVYGKAFDKLFKPAIRLNNGLFHTAKLFERKDSEGSPQPLSLYLKRPKPFPQESLALDGLGVRRVENHNDELEMMTLAEEIGVSINLQQVGGKLQLQFGESGEHKKQGPLFPFSSLPKPRAGHYYKIVFNNDCRQEIKEEFLRRVSNKGSDLPEYYKVIPGIPENEHLVLHQGPVTQAEYPCIPILPGP